MRRIYYAPPPDPAKPFDRALLIIILFCIMYVVGLILALILAIIGFSDEIAIYAGIAVSFVLFAIPFIRLICACFLWIFEENPPTLLMGTITRTWKLFILIYILIPLFTMILAVYMLTAVLFSELTLPPNLLYNLFVTYRAGPTLLLCIPFAAFMLGFIPKKSLTALKQHYFKLLGAL